MRRVLLVAGLVYGLFVAGCDGGGEGDANDPSHEDPCTPTAEICDGIDNDCEGVVDNGDPGAGEACETGEPGPCAAGTLACRDGALVCTQNVQPSAEICDGLDNDCDGAVDQGCGCAVDAQQPCYGGPPGTAGVGLCAAGTQTCEAGQWGGCEGEELPVAEVCDGLDNDCDGAVDEGVGGDSCPTGLQGVCAAGTVSCTEGAPTCVPDVQPSAEICDGLDNDCDGSVDQGNPGGGNACATGRPGLCGTGVTSCSDGELTCTQLMQPAPEICDGNDNDCDGIVDNGNPGGGASCSTGRPGLCAPGVTSCSQGVLSCMQVVQPSAEICDRLDNDCDGIIDDGLQCPTP